MRQFDVVAMFASLWLLASMILDAVTPKELTIYVIGAALAPAFVILAFVYWRLPKLDFAIILATLWLVTVMVLELVTPKPLSLVIAAVAIAPALIVGGVITYNRWRHSKGDRTKPAQPSP